MVYSLSKVWQIVLGCNSACKIGNYCGVKIVFRSLALVNGVLKQCRQHVQINHTINATQLVDFPPKFKTVLSVYIIYTGIFFLKV